MEDECAGREADAVIEVIVVGEGPTEESFIRDVLAPPLADRQIFVQPRLIPTSKHGKGGALSRDRVLRYLRNTLRERGDVYVATFFDLYALDTDFPGRAEASCVSDPLARASAIEKHLAEAVVQAVECRSERFLPHIQPYEFETLLFSDTGRLVEIEPSWKSAAEPLRAVRSSVASPEYINDGVETHPSARLKTLRNPRFEKVLHGPAAAARIGLDCIRNECAHFGGWLSRLEELQPL
jgi:hypothetical protein